MRRVYFFGICDSFDNIEGGFGVLLSYFQSYAKEMLLHNFLPDFMLKENIFLQWHACSADAGYKYNYISLQYTIPSKGKYLKNTKGEILSKKF